MFRRVLLAALLLMQAGFIFADGFIFVEPRPVVFMPRPPRVTPLEVKYHHVSTDIKDGVAVTTIDQMFYNPNNMRLEGTYIFPLPAGATVSKFSMWMNGEEVKGEVLEKDHTWSFSSGFSSKALMGYCLREVNLQ